MGMPIAPTFDQGAYRWRDSVPDPSGVDAAFDAGDTAINTSADLDTDTLYRLRIRIDQTNASATTHDALTTEFLIQYNNGGAGWNDLGAVGADVEDVQYASATGFADGDNTTTSRLSATSLVTGDGMEVAGASDSVTFTDAATSEAELEIALEVVGANVTDNDSITFRVLYSNANESPPATTMGTSVTPTITVNKATSVTVAGELVGAAVVDGALTVERSLSGELVGAAVVDGALTVAGSAGVAKNSNLLFGFFHSLTVAGSVTVAGELVGVGVVDAALTVERSVAGEMVGVGVVDAALTVERSVAGELVGVGVVDAALTVAGSVTVAGEMVGVGVVDGALVITRQPAAELIGVAVQDGALTVERSLVGELVGVSIIDGALTVSGSVSLAGELIGVAVQDGALVITRHLTGDLVGVGILDAALVAGDEVRGELVGAGVLDAALLVTRSLAGELVGVAAADGALLITRYLTGDLVGVAILDGAIRIAGTVELVGDLVGVSILDGSLDAGSVFLDEIDIWLSNGAVASHSGEGGWYSWKGMLPDSQYIPDRAVALIETGGAPQIPNLAIDQPTFDVLVRGARLSEWSTAYTEAETEAYAVRDRFHAVANQPINGVRYVWITAEQDIEYEGEDDNQRPMFRGRFRALREV